MPRSWTRCGSGGWRVRMICKFMWISCLRGGLGPAPGSPDALLPSGVALIAFVLRHRRMKLAFQDPGPLEVLQRRPDARRQAGQHGGTEGGCLALHRALDDRAQEISLDLKQEVVASSAAVHPQGLQGESG